jgi:hypothetical protein
MTGYDVRVRAVEDLAADPFFGPSLPSEWRVCEKAFTTLPEVSQPRLEISPGDRPGEMKLQVTASDWPCCCIQWCTDLGGQDNWLPLATVGMTNCAYEFTDTNGLAPRGFYRAIFFASNSPPALRLASPANGASFLAMTDISLTVDVSDTDGRVVKVEFFEGHRKLGEALNSPFSFAWHNVPVGTYTLTAKATDDLGASAVSSPVAVIVEEGVVACSVRLLARYLGVPEDRVQVISVQEVEWPDSSLGCPEPGGVYLPIMIPGHLLFLAVGAQPYELHSGLGHIILCDPILQRATDLGSCD